MNSQEADRQIEQMIAFIAQEAKEKAEEIQTKTEKEFMAEKLSLETQLSQQIRSEHEKSKQQYYITKRMYVLILILSFKITVFPFVADLFMSLVVSPIQ